MSNEHPGEDSPQHSPPLESEYDDHGAEGDREVVEADLSPEDPAVNSDVESVNVWTPEAPGAADTSDADTSDAGNSEPPPETAPPANVSREPASDDSGDEGNSAGDMGAGDMGAGDMGAGDMGAGDMGAGDEPAAIDPSLGQGGDDKVVAPLVDDDTAVPQADGIEPREPATAKTDEDPEADEAATEPSGAQESDAEGSENKHSVRSWPLPRVIAVANQKGGVGKTTTTVNLAACLAEQGYRTLLVDLDPQANATTGLGLEPRSLESSIYHVMLHNVDADSCIEPTEVKNLFVLPSSLDLAGAEIELVPAMSREHRLRLAIESVIDDYDYVLIDCPPSLGLLTVNALAAAKEVLVPIQCEYYALEGLGQLMRNVDLVKANLNPELDISHIVLVMFDPRTKLAGAVVDEVRGHFGDRVCKNVIPRTVRLSEAPSFGQPITTFDTASRGATAYRAVAQEVIDGQE